MLNGRHDDTLHAPSRPGRRCARGPGRAAARRRVRTDGPARADDDAAERARLPEAELARQLPHRPHPDDRAADDERRGDQPDAGQPAGVDRRASPSASRGWSPSRQERAGIIKGLDSRYGGAPELADQRAAAGAREHVQARRAERGLQRSRRSSASCCSSRCRCRPRFSSFTALPVLRGDVVGAHGPHVGAGARARPAGQPVLLSPEPAGQLQQPRVRADGPDARRRVGRRSAATTPAPGWSTARPRSSTRRCPRRRGQPRPPLTPAGERACAGSAGAGVLLAEGAEPGAAGRARSAAARPRARSRAAATARPGAGGRRLTGRLRGRRRAWSRASWPASSPEWCRPRSRRSRSRAPVVFVVLVRAGRRLAASAPRCRDGRGPGRDRERGGARGVARRGAAAAAGRQAGGQADGGKG